MCIQGVQDRAQYTALGGSNVHFNGCRFVEAKFNMLRTVRQIVLDPCTDGLVKAQVQQFVHENVWYDGIKSRAKVNEKYPYIALPVFQMVQSKVDSQGNGISGGSFSSVGKLIWIKGWREACLNMIQDQFFKALHNNGSKSNWPVVVQVCRILLFEDWDDGGRF